MERERIEEIFRLAKQHGWDKREINTLTTVKHMFEWSEEVIDFYKSAYGEELIYSTGALPEKIPDWVCEFVRDLLNK